MPPRDSIKILISTAPSVSKRGEDLKAAVELVPRPRNHLRFDELDGFASGWFLPIVLGKDRYAEGCIGDGHNGRGKGKRGGRGRVTVGGWVL